MAIGVLHGVARRGVLWRFGLAVATALGVISVGVAGPAAGAQECSGEVSASVSTESLPGGTWTAEGGCLAPESFYEFVEGPVVAKVGISRAVYADGHSGRVAVGVLTLGTGVGLAIVGVEDSATGLVKWSAVLGDFTDEGDAVSVSGEGVSLLPVEPADVSATLSGTGTDIGPLLDGPQDDAVRPGVEGSDDGVRSVDDNAAGASGAPMLPAPGTDTTGVIGGSTTVDGSGAGVPGPTEDEQATTGHGASGDPDRGGGLQAGPGGDRTSAGASSGEGSVAGSQP